MLNVITQEVTKAILDAIRDVFVNYAEEEVKNYDPQWEGYDEDTGAWKKDAQALREAKTFDEIYNIVYKWCCDEHETKAWFFDAFKDVTGF